jgi:hypothetical protein
MKTRLKEQPFESPLKNPNLIDDKAKAGERIFEREGWVRCHTPPLLQTTNSLAGRLHTA